MSHKHLLSSRTLRRWTLGAMLLLVLFSACDDEDDVNGPISFRVILEVTDPDGMPVQGLELGMAPDSPWYMDGKGPLPGTARAADQLRQPYPNPFSPGITIPFELDVSSHVTVTIGDVEATVLRTLLDGQLDNGPHEVVWNGQDDSGARVPSGVYTVRLVVRELESETLLLDDQRQVLLAVFTADQVKVGTTDSRGRIVLEDQRLFPFLYDLPEFSAADETGQIIGTIQLGPTIRFYFTDPAADTTLRYDRDVVGSTTLRFQWDPPPAAR